MKLETQTHLTALRDLLTYRLAELRADLHAAQLARRGRGDGDRDVTDRKDEVEWQREEATDEVQEGRDLAEMLQVEAALHRLDVGRYGDCASCGDAIPLARLLAQPAAERCAACQAVLERRASVGA